MTIQALSQLIIYLLILFTLGYFLSGYIMQRMQAPISRLESRGFTALGMLIKSYIKNSIELQPMATLNYIVEKEENKGGPGADFIIEVEGLDDTVKPVIEAVMIGNFSNKAFAFNTQGTPVMH